LIRLSLSTPITTALAISAPDCSRGPLVQDNSQRGRSGGRHCRDQFHRRPRRVFRAQSLRAIAPIRWTVNDRPKFRCAPDMMSSCLDVTRIWRRTDRASLEKKPSTRLSHEPWACPPSFLCGGGRIEHARRLARKGGAIVETADRYFSGPGRRFTAGPRPAPNHGPGCPVRHAERTGCSRQPRSAFVRRAFRSRA
jgi:hypothetical protein